MACGGQKGVSVAGFPAASGGSQRGDNRRVSNGGRESKCGSEQGQPICLGNRACMGQMRNEFEFSLANTPVEEDGHSNGAARNIGGEDEGRKATNGESHRRGSQVIRKHVGCLAAGERDRRSWREPNGRRRGERHTQEGGGGGRVEVEEESILKENARSRSLDRGAYLSWWWRGEVPSVMPFWVGLVSGQSWWLRWRGCRRGLCVWAWGF